MKVVVASLNPVKVAAVKQGFARVYQPSTEIDYANIEAVSGVSPQPQTDEETLAGATNRAYFAKKHYSDAHLWVGLEGGIATRGSLIDLYSWVVVLSNTHEGQARTSAHPLPPVIAQLVRTGMEVGDATDTYFATINNKQGNGLVGILTHNAITRTSWLAEAVIFALIPHIHPHLYTEKSVR